MNGCLQAPRASALGRSLSVVGKVRTTALMCDAAVGPRPLQLLVRLAAPEHKRPLNFRGSVTATGQERMARKLLPWRTFDRKPLSVYHGIRSDGEQDRKCLPMVCRRNLPLIRAPSQEGRDLSSSHLPRMPTRRPRPSHTESLTTGSDVSGGFITVTIASARRICEVGMRGSPDGLMGVQEPWTGSPVHPRTCGTICRLTQIPPRY